MDVRVPIPAVTVKSAHLKHYDVACVHMRAFGVASMQHSTGILIAPGVVYRVKGVRSLPTGA